VRNEAALNCTRLHCLATLWRGLVLRHKLLQGEVLVLVLGLSHGSLNPQRQLECVTLDDSIRS
jgi:hypothetical protein